MIAAIITSSAMFVSGIALLAVNRRPGRYAAEEAEAKS